MTPAPDLLVLNARIRTLDPRAPRAEALAVSGGRIVALGRSRDLARLRGRRTLGRSRDLARLRGRRTRVLDARGQLVLPGFNDAHVHFLLGGFSLTEVDLRDAASPEEFTRRIAAKAARQPRGSWITGGSWDHENWPGATLPEKHWLDAATPHHPGFVRRLDAHMALANTRALQLAGIDRCTDAPPGGEIVRDARGEPTGLLKDAAMNLIARVLPAPTFADKLAAARAASRHAATLGVTSVQDMLANEDAAVFQVLLERGELLTRIYACRTITRWQTLADAGIRAAFGSPMLRLGAVKGFADGSLGSATARFFHPYCDQPGNRGLWFDEMLPDGAMLERALAADRAGLQLIIHAIGDEANAAVLDLYRDVARRHGPRDRRSRIEHAQHLRARDLPRFARQGVLASVQPYHAVDDGRWCEPRLGSRRLRGTYAFRSLLESGATLALGTDWTVAPLNPLLTLAAAVGRQTSDGLHPNGWFPDQCLTLAQALHAYTVGSATAEFTEHDKGTLAPGKLADFILLDEDLFRLRPEAIAQARVTHTVMNGQVVCEAPG